MQVSDLRGKVGLTLLECQSRPKKNPNIEGTRHPVYHESQGYWCAFGGDTSGATVLVGQLAVPSQVQGAVPSAVPASYWVTTAVRSWMQLDTGCCQQLFIAVSCHQAVCGGAIGVVSHKSQGGHTRHMG